MWANEPEIAKDWKSKSESEEKLEEMSSFIRDDYQDVYATARMAHMGQKRRDGKDYFTHPSEVRNLTRKYYPNDKVAQMAALLHDSLEDAPGSTVDSVEEMEQYIRGSIRSPGAAEEVIETVRALTHEKGANYTEYVLTLLSKPTALRVKLVDMLHNLSSTPTPRQKKKYETALLSMQDAAGGIPSSISTPHWEQLMKLTESTRIKITRPQIRKIIEGFLPDIMYQQADKFLDLSTAVKIGMDAYNYNKKKSEKDKTDDENEEGESLSYHDLRSATPLKEENYYNELPGHHVDGHPWCGSLEDLAYHQGRTWGHGGIVDQKGFSDQIDKSVRLARGVDKSPLRLSEKRLKKLVKEILRKELSGQ